MLECKECGAPCSNVPDGDLYYELPYAQRKALQQPQWQDISTAPRDGTKVCGYLWCEYLDCPDIETTKTVWWDSKFSEWKSYTGSTLWHGFQPTHWQPLPEPPHTGDEG